MLTSREVAVLDANAAALGVPRGKLMESSGNAVARTVRSIAESDDSIAIVTGRGNNGGDGFVAARFLDDFDVSVHLLGRPESITTEIAHENWEVLEASTIATETVVDASEFDLGSADVVVDAMLGTGITGALREPERTAAERINDSSATVVAVDLPSGIDADTGEAADISVDADEVVTFHGRRAGLAGHENVTVADIGIPRAASLFTGPGDRLRLHRNPAGHKGDFGRVFVIGGGPYTGAPALVGQAALRSGADLAFLAVPEPIADTVQGYDESLIVEPFDGARLTLDDIPSLLEDAETRDVVVIGPGLGDRPETRKAVAQFLDRYGGRAVVDADALPVVPEVETAATLVCTPHRGEYREMGGEDDSDWRTRSEHVEAFATSLGHTMLVKGPYDVISNGEVTRVNRTGNPGMTVGGTGDVLAGSIGALLAVLDPPEAAALGTFATGFAGDAAAATHDAGLVATDLLPELPPALWGDVQ